MSPLRTSRVVRGFTIIELMVVLVVTAIVLAVGLPAYSNAKLSSKLRNYSTKMVSVVILHARKPSSATSPLSFAHRQTVPPALLGATGNRGGYCWIPTIL